MAKFRKGGSRQMAALSTASLPDIVFMLLFFFMSVTTMKETDYKVKIKLRPLPRLRNSRRSRL